MNLYEKCDVNTVCNEGSCYAQNTWFSQCLNYCPKGWSCQSNKRNLIFKILFFKYTFFQDPSVNSSNLVLWQYDDIEQYFKKINNTNWVMIINTAVVYNLIQISSLNDSVILFEPLSKLYYSLDSNFVYLSASLKNILSSGSFQYGSWIIDFYEAKG